MAELTNDSASTTDPQAGYTVLARRYRPSDFDQCIGQEHVSDALKNAITLNRVAHAYLFTGARGVGKTSMARILAKALNCVEGPTISPCGKCDMCQAISTGEDVDVIEIDGASNNGVDQVRELRQAVNFRPSRGKYKIYIIDEVHMLSNSAFNALLKTLEEPPAHAKFIFATTEVQKIPITVLSRCQRFDFAGIEMTRIFDHLKKIVKAEGLKADDEALELIARRAGGSMRDSQSLLDQLLAFGGESLSSEDVHRVLGTAGDERVFGLADAILTGAADRCLSMVADAFAAGVQLGEWLEQVLDFFRDLMVLAVDPNAELVSMSNRHRPRMAELARKLPPEGLLERMDLLAHCRGRMKHSTYGRTLLEMTLVRLCRLEQFISLSGALAAGPQVSAEPSSNPALKKNEPRLTTPPIASTARMPYPAPMPTQTPTQNGAAPAPVLVEPAVTEESEPSIRVNLDAATAGQIAEAARGNLQDVVLASMLGRASEIEFQAPAGIMLKFPAELNVAKDHCEGSTHLDAFVAECSRIAGQPIAIRFSLTVASNVNTGSAAIVRRPGTARLRDVAMRHPLVLEAEKLFGAKIIAVDPLPKQAEPARIVEPEPIAEPIESDEL